MTGVAHEIEGPHLLSKQMMIKKSDGEWVFMDGSGLGLGSETTAATSGAQLGKREPKKVLSFKLFKSLKSTEDIQEKFQLGAVLGKGSFGEVRKCLNKQTGMECALKIVQKSHIGQHRILVELMEQELEVL
jgi:calcium-dependent protein kinase